MNGHSRGVLAGLALSCLSTAAVADSPSLIGTYKDWSAFQSSANGRKMCYVLGKPDATEPKKAKRDPIFFMISDWPSRKAKGEVQVIPGYTYKDGGAVTAQIGAEKFDLFTQGDKAWVEDVAQEKALVAAMEKGAKVVITGVSQRGTTTHDTYSLSGISDALSKVHEACGM